MHDVGKIAIPDAILQNSGKFKAQPKQSGYIRTPYTTVTFTNQVAKRSATRTKRLFELPEKHSAMRSTRKNTPDHKENVV